MAQKHLHELLKEDQEPFHLKNYIADRRCNIKTSTQLQLKKRKPISAFPANFCKNACFFSFTNSPDLRKSPLFEFTSPVRSPCKSPNSVFLHLPERTAAVLLDAAPRIQKNGNASTKQKNSGFGLLGSMLKKLKQKSRTEKCSVKDILKWESFVSRKSFRENNAKSHSCELSNGRPSSAVWSESNEETKSFDMESSSSSSSSSHSDNDFEFVSKQRRHVLVFDCFENDFCESPFRFVLQRSPSPDRGTPEFSSPVASPRPLHGKQEEESFEDVKSLKEFQGQQEENEEDKEDQFSSVSVLGPPFQDYEGRQDGDYEDEDEGYDIQCSYENIQRAKQQLLQKLHRFEKLSELDPIELEKRIFEQEYDDDYNNDTNDLEEGECDDNEFELSEQINKSREFAAEICSGMKLFQQHYIPKDMNMLIMDLIAEEEQTPSGFVNREVTQKRVCQRLESWKEVEYNTIDMMVEQDLKRDHDWMNHRSQVGETALTVELAIFKLLVEELSEELMH